ncbi:MAG: putative DNA binding domain-containing protein [Lewinellaceae bacterium]|nr:putative DNA binding domain-containing protein [Saprospiraceae bacterium]MCB9338470.1 putative DNA binding domain-containing protein [Lewinellaceae bacterium]
MAENQHIEWKSVWKDEYLKWICGFANANGGRLELGKDDKGDVIGLAGTQKLMMDLPNKVRDMLGIIVDVDLHLEKGKEWISVKVEPSPFPVSYMGQYHYRSGSTKQELKGASLTRFLLQKQGKHWDGIAVPHATVEELSPAAFGYFRKKALQSGRLDEKVLNLETDLLIDKLRLRENGMLKRAALLLFHPEPERFFTGAFVKIGYFRTPSDLRYQDVIEGNIFEQVERTMDLLMTKYMSAQIRYEGISRIEEFPYPKAALREAVLNAVAHKDYSSGNPVQIKVYEDRINIWNAGQLPPSLTIDNLKQDHPSIPYNPDIATAFFRAGLIEAWGRGTLMIIEECEKHRLPLPVFATDEAGFGIEFKAAERKMSGKTSEKMSGKVPEKILALVSRDAKITIALLSNEIGVTERTIERNLKKLQEENRIKRIGPDKGGHWEIMEG